MTDIEAGRDRTGCTRGRPALLVVLVLVLAGGAAAYMLRQGRVAPQTVAGKPLPSAVSRSVTPASAAPSPSIPRKQEQQPKQLQPSARAPDSAEHEDSVFVDPAAAAPSPQWDASAPPTCGQWRGLLSDDEQTSYAAALLSAAWTNDEAAGIPAAGTVRSYRSAMTAACLGTGAEDDNISDVARVLYAADPGKWGP